MADYPADPEDFLLSDFVVSGALTAALSEELAYAQATIEAMEVFNNKLNAGPMQAAIARDMVAAAGFAQAIKHAKEGLDAIATAVGAIIPPTEVGGAYDISEVEEGGANLLSDLENWRSHAVSISQSQTSLLELALDNPNPTVVTPEDVQAQLDELAAAIIGLNTLAPVIPANLQMLSS
jgi:hypothetical protein